MLIFKLPITSRGIVRLGRVLRPEILQFFSSYPVRLCQVYSLLECAFRSLLFFIASLIFSIPGHSDTVASTSIAQCRGGLNPAAVEERAENNLLNSTAGMEFEGSVPAQLEFRILAERIRSNLESQYPNDEVWVEEEPFGTIENSYHVKHSHDGWIDTYSVKVEGNLVSERRYEPEVKGVEITSPIMRTEEQVAVYIWILDDLRALGLKSRPDRGGIHVHRGVSPDETLKRVSELYTGVYKLMRSASEHFRLGSERGEFLDLWSLRSIVDSFQAVAEANPEATLSNGDVSQIAKRSVLRYEQRYSTIELRIFNSTLNQELNHFYFLLTQAIFDSWKLGQSSEVWSYIMSEEELDFSVVLEMMGFEVESVLLMLEDAAQKVEQLERQVGERKRRELPSQYVLASEVEQLVDQFWEPDHDSATLEQAIRQYRRSAPERDVQIGLFNILQHPKFRGLSKQLRSQLLLDFRELFELEQFIVREIWAIEVSQVDDFGSALGRTLTNTNVVAPELGLPLMRWTFYRLAEDGFDVYAFAAELAETPGALDQLFLLTESHMLVRKPIQRDIHFALLAAMLRVSNKPLHSMTAITILQHYQAEFQSRRVNLTPLFDEILNKSYRSHRVFLELITYINQLKLRGSRATEDVSNVKELIGVGIGWLERGKFPRILSGLVSYLGYNKDLLSEEELSSTLESLSRAFSIMSPDLTAEEISSLRLTYRLSSLRDIELSASREFLRQLGD